MGDSEHEAFDKPELYFNLSANKFRFTVRTQADSPMAYQGDAGISGTGTMSGTTVCEMVKNAQDDARFACRQRTRAIRKLMNN